MVTRCPEWVPPAQPVDSTSFTGTGTTVEGSILHSAVDAALPSLLSALREDDCVSLLLTNGNDPTTPSTTHARECVPMLAFGSTVRSVSVVAVTPSPTLVQPVAAWFEYRSRGPAAHSCRSCAPDGGPDVPRPGAGESPALTDRVLTVLRERRSPHSSGVRALFGLPCRRCAPGN